MSSGSMYDNQDIVAVRMIDEPTTHLVDGLVQNSCIIPYRLLEADERIN